jgi:hypothetical protein
MVNFNYVVYQVVMEICGLPLTIKLAKKLKTMERIDIYDIDTKFNIFSLDARYVTKQNKYLSNCCCEENI